MALPSALLSFFFALQSPALAGDRALYEGALNRVKQSYLRLDGLSGDYAFMTAAEAAEDAIPWLIVDVEAGRAVLRHGMTGEIGAVSLARLPGTDQPDLDALPDALAQLEDLIEGAAAPLPDELDLPVTLLTGFCRALDRHSVVLAGSKLERFDERLKGRMSGIGSRIGLEDGQLVVKEVFSGSPAKLGGLLPGDVVIAIDGFSTLGIPVSEAVERIRGPVDSEVALTVLRADGPGEPRTLVLRLKRAEVDIPNVSWALRPSGVGLATVDHFSEHTVSLLREAFADFTSGTTPLRGLIIDLRGNSGGSMIQAARSADLLLDDGVLVRTAGRNGEAVPNLLREVRAYRDGDELAVPVVVLIDSASASASEILGGALSLLDRAALVGERSYGKGTVQKLYTLRDGDEPVRLKLTVAEYRLTGDVPVADVGLTPDLWVSTAVLGRLGASLPLSPDEGSRAVTFVEEYPGWRGEGDPADRGDEQVALAERLLLDARGPARSDVLAAMNRVVPSLRVEEEARLREAFSARGLDWRRAGTAVGQAVRSPGARSLEGVVSARLEQVEPARAGGEAPLRAVFRNDSDQPLYQAQLRLSAEDPRSPWDGLTLPLGFVPPGEEAVAEALLALDPHARRREDRVAVRLEAEGQEPVSLAPVLLTVLDRPAPPILASARLVPDGGATRAEITLENKGSKTLTGLRVRFSFPEDEHVALLDRDGLLPTLKAGGRERVDLRLDLSPGAPARIPLELHVEAELYGEIARLPLSLPTSGEPDAVEAPELSVGLPLAAPLGTVVLSVDARDDRAIQDLTVWQGSQKIAWRRGTGRRLHLEIPIAVDAGTWPVTVEVKDDQGARERQVTYIRGVRDETLDAAKASHTDDGAAESQP